MVRCRKLIPFCLLAGTASASWLDEGIDYGEIRPWFSDTIFCSSPGSPRHAAFNEQYYPYFKKSSLNDLAQPIRLRKAGTWPINRMPLEIYPPRPAESGFPSGSPAISNSGLDSTCNPMNTGLRRPASQ